MSREKILNMNLSKACQRHVVLRSLSKRVPFGIQRVHFVPPPLHHAPPHHHPPPPPPKRRLFRSPFFRRWTRRALILGLGVAAFSYFMDADFITYSYDLYRSKYDKDGMQDKTVWIVGASSGIGEYLVYELVKSGAKRIILSSRRIESLKRVKQECENIITQTNQQRTQQSVNTIQTQMQDKINAEIQALKDNTNDTDTVDPSQITQIKQRVRNQFKSLLENAKQSPQSALECEIIIHPLDMLQFVENPGSADTFVESLLHDLDARFVSESERGGLHVEPSDIDILVINSGRTQRSLALENTQDILEYVQQLNVNAPIVLSQAMAKYWINNINAGKINRKNKKLHQIAVTGSLAGVIGSPKQSAYSMSKAAIARYVEAMRVELVNDKIDINLICPGPVRLSSESHASLGNATDDKLRSRYEGRLNNGSDMTLERCASLYTTMLQYSIVESWISSNPVLLIAYARQYLPVLLGPSGVLLGSRYIARKKDVLHESTETA
eukprot:285042_1